MSGYLNFNSTGVPIIDAIAEALESAGNAYHHTECWGDEYEYGDDKRSHIELIQDALNQAALAVKRIQSETRGSHA